MATEPPLEPPERQRFLKRLASWIVRAVYRSVEVYRAPGSPTDGPVVGVANHFGGFADALLLIYASPRHPRFIARDVIWKVPLVGMLMRRIGAIPVHKPQDKGPASNDQMFASAYEALDYGDLLTIFPEGEVSEDPSILEVKTGAARIAVGARAAGTPGINIVPTGIHYADKATLRSRAFVNFGPPIDLDAEAEQLAGDAGTLDASDRQAVHRLTDRIERGLRDVAPDFADWKEAHALSHAAEVAIRSGQVNPGEEVAYSEKERLAGLMGRAGPDQRKVVAEAVHNYEAELDAVGLTDEQLFYRTNTSGFLGYLLGSLAVALLLLPFAIVGALLNVIPFLIVRALNFLPIQPGMAATLKPIAAVFLFGVTWGIQAWGAFQVWSVPGVAAVLLLMPVYLAAVIVLVERLTLLGRTVRSWRRVRNHRDLLEDLKGKRSAVVQAVAEAV